MLTKRDVVDLLTELNARCSAGSLGVTFYRIESGSGVAGGARAFSTCDAIQEHLRQVGW